MAGRVYAPNSINAERKYAKNRARHVAIAQANQNTKTAAYEAGRAMIEARQRGEPTPKFVTAIAIAKSRRQ